MNDFFFLIYNTYKNYNTGDVESYENYELFATLLLHCDYMQTKPETHGDIVIQRQWGLK